jgi:hypothetical protein
MRRLMIIAAAVASLAGSAEIGGSAQAGSLPNAGLGVLANGAFPLEEVQYAWGGRNYCWYGNGWQGPGWYWCGATPGVTALAGVAALAGMVGSGAAAPGVVAAGMVAVGMAAVGMAAPGMAVEDAGTVAVVGAAKAWFGDKDHEKKR